jgi:ADP-ribosylglycohydrolase
VTNRQLLEELIARGKVNMRGGELRLPAPTKSRAVDFDRVEGMLLGTAIGDSLGNTHEGMTRGERRRRLGKVSDYLPNRYAAGSGVGLPSDDTQLTFWAVEQILEDGEYVPDKMASKFTHEQIFGIGSTVREFLRNYRDHGVPWFEAGPTSAGNGALMRMAAVPVPHMLQATDELFVDAILNTMTTHNDSAAISSSVGFVQLLWDSLTSTDVPPRDYWLPAFLTAARLVEADSEYSMRGGDYANFRGHFSTFVETVVSEAVRDNLAVGPACDRWYSGAYLPETVPSALYILIQHAGDPEEAIVRAVNDTKDNDTVGAIVGAVVGALHGASALPQRWRTGLLGRLGSDDDGHVQTIIERLRAQWHAGAST